MQGRLNNWQVPAAIILIILVALSCLVWALLSGAQRDREVGIQLVSSVYRWRLKSLAKEFESEFQFRGHEFSSNRIATIQKLALDGFGVAWKNSEGTWVMPNERAIIPFSSSLASSSAVQFESRGEYAEAGGLFLSMAKDSPLFYVDSIRCFIKGQEFERSITTFATIPKTTTDSRGVPIQILAGLLILRESENELVSDTVYQLLSDYSLNFPSRTRLFLLKDFLRTTTDQERVLVLGRMIEAETVALEFVKTDQFDNSLVIQRLPGGRTLLWHRDIRLAVIRTSDHVYKLENGEQVYLLPETERSPLEQEGNWINQALPREFGGWRLAVRMDDDMLNQASSKRANQRMWIAMILVCCVCCLGAAAIYLVLRQLKRVSMKNSLAATVSHELKTPLASMRLMIEALKDNDISFGDKSKCLEILDGENLRLSRLVDQFLNFSRMERGGGTFEKEAIDIVEVVSKAVAVMNDQQHHCELIWNPSPQEIAIHANRDAILTMVINLLENAIKYSTKDPVVVIEINAIDSIVILTIEDNGIGMTPHQLKRATKLFYQSDRSMTRVSEGCGMGLSIVQWIVDGHSGMLNLRSTINEGTIAEIRLPLNEKSQ